MDKIHQTVLKYWISLRNGDVKATTDLMSWKYARFHGGDMRNMSIKKIEDVHFVHERHPYLRTLEDRDFSIEIRTHDSLPDHVYLYDVVADGKLLYSEQIEMDGDKIARTGNFSGCEIVEKFAIDKNQFYPSFAIKPNRWLDIKFLKIKINRSIYLSSIERIQHGSSFDEDGFYYLKTDHSVDGRSIPICISVSYSDGSVEKSTVVINGSDCKWFAPLSKGSLANLYKKQMPWSLTSQNMHIMFPKARDIENMFEKECSFILTDALDNDWNVHPTNHGS